MITNERAIGLLKVHARYADMTHRADLHEAVQRGIEALKREEKFSLDKEKILMEAKQGCNGSKRAKRVRLERVLGVVNLTGERC